MKKGNLYKNIPRNLPKELFNKLVSNNKIKIERIVSKQHKTPKGKWYDQDKNEFVLVIEGNAELTFIKNNSKKRLKIKKGDYVNIPAHLKHRVERTSKKTIWLTIFY